MHASPTLYQPSQLFHPNNPGLKEFQVQRYKPGLSYFVYNVWVLFFLSSEDPHYLVFALNGLICLFKYLQGFASNSLACFKPLIISLDIFQTQFEFHSRSFKAFYIWGQPSTVPWYLYPIPGHWKLLESTVLALPFV